jgi:hypothetical protein
VGDHRRGRGQQQFVIQAKRERRATCGGQQLKPELSPQRGFLAWHHRPNRDAYADEDPHATSRGDANANIDAASGPDSSGIPALDPEARLATLAEAQALHDVEGLCNPRSTIGLVLQNLARERDGEPAGT